MAERGSTVPDPTVRGSTVPDPTVRGSTVLAELRRRLADEQPVLCRAFPGATLDLDSRTLTLAEHRLPAGWSQPRTDVLVAIGLNYPAGQPDNVCVRPDLTLAGGGLPDNHQGIRVHAGRPWLQLSFHLHPADWRPQADPVAGSNLAEYLAGALTRFDEAS